jgi:preprotein translocase subunit SecB
MAEEETQAAAGGEVPQQQFTIQRIYTKDLSFESPASPNVFRKQWQPKVNVDLNTRSTPVDEEGNFEVVLTLTITATQDEETAFLVEIQQAGIFFIKGIEGPDLQRVLGTAEPNILFPYARENIDSIVVKGGFPPVMLAPVNFDGLYQQALAQAEQQAAQPGGGESATH